VFIIAVTSDIPKSTQRIIINALFLPLVIKINNIITVLKVIILQSFITINKSLNLQLSTDRFAITFVETNEL